MSLFSPAKNPGRQKLRIIHFGSVDWGFTDASMPKVRTLLASLAEEEVEVFHSGLTVKFRGEEKKTAYENCKVLLEELIALPEFEGFKIGAAEGESANAIDDGRILTEAMKSGRG